MAATTTELMVRLVADTKGFAAELGGATQDIDKLHAKAVRMGTAMQDVGRRMTLGFTVPFVAGMGLAVKAASDLEESQNKVNVVFGRNSDAINRWARTSATAFGMSRAAAYEASGTFGNLFISLGVGEKQAVGMSKKMVELAADLASFNNMDVTDVLNRLRSGLLGEQEAMERLGVVLSETTLKQKAFDMGLVDNTTSVLPPAIKTQAAYALILEQTTTAQGDFARTSDGAANSMRIAQAQLSDAAASIGATVLPIFADMVAVLADVAQWFANLPGPIKTAIVILGGLVAAAGPVLWVTGSMVKNVGALIQAFPQLRTAAVGAFSALGAASGPALVVGITAIGVALAQSTHKSLDYEKATRAIVRANDEAQASMFMQTAMVARLTGGLNGIIAPHRLFAEVLEQGVGPAQRLIDNLQAAGYNTKAFEKALRDEVSAQKQANADSERGAAILSDLGTEAGDTAASIDDLRTAFDDLTNAQFDVEGSAIRMEQAIQNLDEAVRTGKDGTLEGRQAFLDAKRSIDDWGQSVYDNAIAAGKSTADASAEQQWALGQVAGSLAPDSPLRQWLDQYIGGLNSIPRDINTVLSIQTAADDLAQRVIGSASAWVLDRRAAGGPVANGMPYLVGENGPEIFVPGASGAIIPNHVAMGGGSTMAAATGGSYTFHIYDATDPEKVMSAIARAVSNGSSVPPRVRAAFAG